MLLDIDKRIKNLNTQNIVQFCITCMVGWISPDQIFINLLAKNADQEHISLMTNKPASGKHIPTS